jgi:hypothetical protein
MSDTQAIYAEISAAQSEEREISDACARVIASQWYSENAGASFVTTGAITVEPSTLWNILFSPEYNTTMSAGDRLMADMLGTYLVNAGERGSVDGWSGLWLDR